MICLEENYRSRNAILKLANAVIGGNLARHRKTLFSRLGEGEPPRLRECENQDDEAQTVAREIAERVRGGRPPRDFAVIVRANLQTKPFEEEFRRWHIPYEVVGGQSFYDCKEVMDMLAYLAVALNPRDDGALKRIVNTPPRGIGDKSLERLIDWAAARQAPLSRALQAAGVGEVAEIGGGAREGCRDLAEKIARWGE
ncbi:MAG: DNA helicase UvrD, partial [Planctomycetes bacterium]|nr:DNA helicase UvrD [Planctomycetota bacterium]